ncbi:MAG: hypothetical protein EOP49_49605, partial [Sphingobacteriales bacterium]
MARSKNNIATQGLSGSIDQFVFRQLHGKTVVAKRPKTSESVKPAQQVVRNIFKMATIYAKNALSNPVLLQFYRSKARKGQSPYNMALADYCKPPEIGDIDASSYNGSIGSTIKVVVTDNGKVESVKLKIQKGSLIEEGDAVLQSDGLTWMFTTTVANSTLNGTIISVDATDLAGRHSI